MPEYGAWTPIGGRTGFASRLTFYEPAYGGLFTPFPGWVARDHYGVIYHPGDPPAATYVAPNPGVADWTWSDDFALTARSTSVLFGLCQWGMAPVIPDDSTRPPGAVGYQLRHSDGTSPEWYSQEWCAALGQGELYTEWVDAGGPEAFQQWVILYPVRAMSGTVRIRNRGGTLQHSASYTISVGYVSAASVIVEPRPDNNEVFNLTLPEVAVTACLTVHSEELEDPFAIWETSWPTAGVIETLDKGHGYRLAVLPVIQIDTSPPPDYAAGVQLFYAFLSAQFTVTVPANEYRWIKVEAVQVAPPRRQTPIMRFRHAGARISAARQTQRVW